SILPSIVAATLIRTYGRDIARGTDRLIVRAEAVPDGWLGQDPARSARLALQLAAPLGHEGPQVGRPDLGPPAPRGAEQVPVGQDAVGVGDQDAQQLVFGRSQVDLASVDDHAACHQVDHQAASTDDRLVVAPRLLAAERRADARQELLSSE